MSRLTLARSGQYSDDAEIAMSIKISICRTFYIKTIQKCELGYDLQQCILKLGYVYPQGYAQCRRGYTK